jgi:hypothetical protein
VDNDVIGRTAGNGVGGEYDGPTDLADPLEAAQPTWLDAKVFHQPVRRHNVFTIDRSSSSARRKKRTGRKPVNVALVQTSISNRFKYRAEREFAETDVGIPTDRAMGVTHHRSTLGTASS